MSGNLKDSFYTRSTTALQFAIKGRIIVKPGEKQFNNLQMGCLVVNTIIATTTSRSKRQIGENVRRPLEIDIEAPRPGGWN